MTRRLRLAMIGQRPGPPVSPKAHEAAKRGQTVPEAAKRANLAFTIMCCHSRGHSVIMIHLKWLGGALAVCRSCPQEDLMWFILDAVCLKELLLANQY